MKSTALAFVLFLLLANNALAVGAIAVDDEQGMSHKDIGYGFVTGYESKEEAQNAALAECRSSGNSNCKVAVWFEACGAYAVSKTHYGVGWGATEEDAVNKALDACGDNCRIGVSKCE